MAEGTAHAGQCWNSQAEAAAMFCSSIGGTTAAGVRQCVGVASGPSASVGGSLTFSYTLRTDGDPASDIAASGFLPGCETYGLDWWSPILGAFFLALVAILAAKMLLRPFRSDRYGV